MASLIRSRAFLWLGMAALTITPLIVVGTPTVASGATGISATPASTLTFDGGGTSATFTRSASGIINETNRVNLSGGSQNPWSSYDVWLQFRPLTGPGGGATTPIPNPNCQPSAITSFSWSNTNAPLIGTTSTGYFIGTNPYEVCVYYVYSISMLANGSSSGVSYDGQPVTYSGVELKGSDPVVSDNVTLTVFFGYGCSYVGAVIPLTTDTTGTFSYYAGPAGTGDYSVQATTSHAQSVCLDLTELPL